jgi:hypothetical protein
VNDKESTSTRVAGWIVGLVLGIVFGVLGTVVSQSSVSVLGFFDLPYGLIVALVAVALLLIGLRLVLSSRIGAILAAAGVVGALGVLSQPSTGGSVLVPANISGYVWILAPSIIALIVLAWPRMAVRVRQEAVPVEPANGHQG